MSNTTDKMLDRYVYLHLEPNHIPKGVTIAVKLDDEGVVVDAFSDGEFQEECLGSTWKLYSEMGIEVTPSETTT